MELPLYANARFRQSRVRNWGRRHSGTQPNRGRGSRVEKSNARTRLLIWERIWEREPQLTALSVLIRSQRDCQRLGSSCVGRVTGQRSNQLNYVPYLCATGQWETRYSAACKAFAEVLRPSTSVHAPEVNCNRRSGNSGKQRTQISFSSPATLACLSGWLDGSVCRDQTANLRPAACSVISRDLRFCCPFLTSR
jgi:hypothetical protein